MKHLLPLLRAAGFIPAVLLLLAGWTAGARAENWSFWRGPEQNGVSRDTDLPDKFDPATGSNVLWRAPYGGITTPIVQNGRVYIITRTAGEQGEGIHQQEQVLCFDAKTGQKLWQHKFNVWHTDIVRDRLGWTNMAGDPETGNVYAHGTQGLLFCYDKDGKVLWRHSLTEEYGRVSGYGGRVTSPIIDGDLLIVSMLNASWGDQTVGGTRLVAFDKRKGDVVWWASTGYRPKDTYYSVPVVANIGGQRLVITGGGDGGVHAFKVRTGEKVWSYLFGTGAVNCSPVVEGDRVYIAHGEDNTNGTQGSVICVDGATVEKGQPKLIWRVDEIKDKYASPLLYKGRLYVCDELGRLYCLDAKNGEQLWEFKYGKNTKGSPVWADGKIYITEVDSGFHVLKPGDTDCEEVSAVYFPARGIVPAELNGSPAIADGRIYFLTNTELYCVGKKDWMGKVGKAPAEPAEGKAAADARPAHLQVVPADVALTPGKGVELKARTFDDHGRLIGEAKVEWSLAGPRPPVFPIGFPPQPPPKTPPAPPPAIQGDLAPSGSTAKFTAARMPPGQFGRVVARLGELTAEARVRVAPVVPHTQTFAQVPVGRTPGGWVNTQGKFSVIRLQDGTKVLMKRNDNASPLVARANAYIGLPDLRDYTIEADLRGVPSGQDLPDMGVSANRYTFFLEGQNQQLRLVSWDAQRRINNTIPWKWKGNTWFRMKLTVSVEGDKAHVRAKVWPRDEQEPEKWTLTVEDPCPNRHGSPTLYGFAYGSAPPLSTIHYANVKLTPNKGEGIKP